MMEDNFIQQLFDTVSARKNAAPETSYTASLFAKGGKKIAQKVGEEATETVLAAAGGDRQEIIRESADLLFHLLVLWSAHDITPDEVAAELKRREGVSGIAEKESRKQENLMTAVNDAALDVMFRNARTHSAWQDKPVEDSVLERVYELCKWGPTSANSSPMRLVFVKSKEARERLKEALTPTNVEKTMNAPVTAIIAHDLEFYEQLPKLFPHADAKAWFAGNDELIKATAFRNSSLQGAYFMLAARALGLDCGPMSGFDNAKVDANFFKGTHYKSNFLCNIGYGDAGKLFPRSPRLTFAEVAKIM